MFLLIGSFFRKHSRLDIDRLVACTNMEEFINALKGNEFYIPLSESRIAKMHFCLIMEWLSTFIIFP